MRQEYVIWDSTRRQGPEDKGDLSCVCAHLTDEHGPQMDINQSTLNVTVVEVLKYDPWCIWQYQKY